MHVEVRPWRDLSEEDLRRCEELEVAVHGPPEDRRSRPSGQLAWGPVDPASDWVVLVWEDGALVSFVVVTERTVLIDDRQARVACIRGMRTHPDHRRLGFGRAAMERGTRFIWEHIRPEMALLLSSEMAVPFYLSLGWKVLPGPVYCEQPDGKINYSELFPRAPAMALTRGEDEPPEGPIDLAGLPF